MNYLNYWSLHRSPFGPVSTHDGFYSGTPQRESIARVDYLVRSNGRTGILLSQRGCGSSTLLRQLAGSSGIGGSAVQPVVTSGGVKTSSNAMKRLAVAMSVDPFGDDLEQRLVQTIRSLGRCQVKTLWLVDRCDQATAQAVARLIDLTPSLAVVMSTSAEAASELRDALDYCPLRLDLEPFRLEDTLGYVRHAVAAAGAANQLFDDSALVRLHELCDGRVAMIAMLADLALLAAAHAGAKRIAADYVESVQQEVIRAA